MGGGDRLRRLGDGWCCYLIAHNLVVLGQEVVELRDVDLAVGVFGSFLGLAEDDRHRKSCTSQLEKVGRIRCMGSRPVEGEAQAVGHERQRVAFLEGKSLGEVGHPAQLPCCAYLDTLRALERKLALETKLV